MSFTRTAVKREGWGSLRKLPSVRWQARYPAPDGETYTARTEDDKPHVQLAAWQVPLR